MALKSITHLSIFTLICVSIYLIYDISSALILSSIAALSILLISFFVCMVGLYRFGNQVTAEVDVNFYELILLISSLAIPFIVLVTLFL